MRSRANKINFMLKEEACKFNKKNDCKHIDSTISNHRDCLVFTRNFCCDFLVGDVYES